MPKKTPPAVLQVVKSIKEYRLPQLRVLLQHPDVLACIRSKKAQRYSLLEIAIAAARPKDFFAPSRGFDSKIVQLLLDAGAYPDQPSRLGLSKSLPLLRALKLGNAEHCYWLMRAGATISAVGGARVAQEAARQKGSLACLLVLLSNGAPLLPTPPPLSAYFSKKKMTEAEEDDQFQWHQYVVGAISRLYIYKDVSLPFQALITDLAHRDRNEIIGRISEMGCEAPTGRKGALIRFYTAADAQSDFGALFEAARRGDVDAVTDAVKERKGPPGDFSVEIVRGYTEAPCSIGEVMPLEVDVVDRGCLCWKHPMPDGRLMTPLEAASDGNTYGHMQCARALRDAARCRGSGREYDHNSQGALLLAAAKGDARLCSRVLQAGCRLPAIQVPDQWLGYDDTVSAFDVAVFRGHMEVALMLLQAGHIPDPVRFVYQLRLDDEETLGYHMSRWDHYRAAHVLPALCADDYETKRDSVTRLHSVFRSCSHLLPEAQRFNPLRSTLLIWRAACVRVALGRCDV